MKSTIKILIFIFATTFTNSCGDYPMICGESDRDEYLLESVAELPVLGDLHYLRTRKNGEMDTLFFKLDEVDTIINRYSHHDEEKNNNIYSCNVLVET